MFNEKSNIYSRKVGNNPEEFEGKWADPVHKFKGKFSIRELKREQILAILCLLLGAVVRLVYLGVVPGGLYWDETYEAWNAFALFHDGIDSSGHVFPVYFEAWAHGQNALYAYLMIPFIAMNQGHINEFIVRLPQVLVAIFSLWAVYLLLKRLFHSKLALWGLFLLAICPWHIMMSRWGLEANLAPGFLLFGLYFFVKGLDNNKFLILSGLFYGLSLYTYAVIWPIVPVMILLEVIYGIYVKKISLNRYSILGICILGILALPLLLFLAVNLGYIEEINTSFFSIYKMTSFRGSELATSFYQVCMNLRTFAVLLIKQNVGQPYDVILPYGLFYDIGRFFIVIGSLALCYKMIQNFIRNRKLIKEKEEIEISNPEFLIFVQLFGAGLIALLISVTMHQINSIYIPMVICEAYGIWFCLEKIGNYRKKAVKLIQFGILAAYFLYFGLFQYHYYTDYRELVAEYFQYGTKEAITYAMTQGDLVIVNDALKYPTVLLYSETTAREYLDTLEYSDSLPAPAYFSKGDVTFVFGFDETQLNTDAIYILYFDQAAFFEEDFNLIPFEDWYVAIPKL